MIISIHDIGRNGRGAHYEWLRANAGGEIYSPDLEYGRYSPLASPLATFERLRSRLSMYEKTAPEGEPVRIVGFGYGGFYAHLLHAGRYNIQTVLVDPLLIPFAPIRLSASPADMEVARRHGGAREAHDGRLLRLRIRLQGKPARHLSLRGADTLRPPVKLQALLQSQGRGRPERRGGQNTEKAAQSRAREDNADRLPQLSNTRRGPGHLTKETES